MTLYITTFDTRVGDLTLHGVAVKHHGYTSIEDLQHRMRVLRGAAVLFRLIPTGIELDGPWEWTRLELR